MILDSRQIVFIEKGQKPRIKVIAGLRPFVGGAGVALKLRQDFGGVCLATGPLSGAYPATGVVIVASKDGLWQLGGDFVLTMALCGVDGVVGVGVSLDELRQELEEYLKTQSEKPLLVASAKEYETIYNKLLSRATGVWFSKGDLERACPTCPLACGRGFRSLGQIDITSLLGACGAVANIYNDTAVTFAALRALGYDYSHEDLETAVLLAQKLLQ